MPASKTPINPNPTRWSPSSDPASIVIPGLDTDASTADQIEQIEQLITIKLQNIDENFAKIHNVLANKLLPAVKRFAVGTEPVREAAKFWTSFYEAAAQIRIPTVDDYSIVNEVPSEREEEESSSHDERKDGDGDTYEEENTMTRPRQEIYETSVVNSETSFLPGQGAISSTPAMARQPTMTMTDQSYATQGSDGPSWTPSLESPLVRLNRELNNFSNETQDDSIIPSTSILPRASANLPPSASRQPAKSDYDYDDSSNFTFQQISKTTPGPSPRSEKGKGKSKEATQPLLKNVLRHNLYSASDNSSFENNTIRLSPSKSRGKPKTPTIDKNLNPYLRGNSTKNDNETTTNTSNWSGIVDLRDRSILTPQRKRSTKAPNAGTTTTPQGNAGIDDEDDSFDGLPPGMSPLVIMSPVPPPRSSAELGLLRLGPTPARDASARIQRDILHDVLQSGGAPHSARRLGTFPKYDDSTSISTFSGNSPSQSRYGLKSFKQTRYGHGNNDHSTSSSTNITKDSSLESMIRNIKNDMHSDVGVTPSGMVSTPGLRIRPRGAGVQGENQFPPFHTYEETPPRQHLQDNYDSSSSEPATPMYGHHPFDHFQQGNEEIIDDGDLSSDSDSLDDEINTAHPSAAFLMASQRRIGIDDDDSFGSSNHSSDSLNAMDGDMQGVEGVVPLHPFEGVVVEDRFEDEDSFDGFDDDGLAAQGQDEETVFGARPYARSERLGPEANRLRMLGEELDTMAIESRFAGLTGPKVAETPTPASRAT